MSRQVTPTRSGRRRVLALSGAVITAAALLLPVGSAQGATGQPDPFHDVAAPSSRRLPAPGGRASAFEATATRKTVSPMVVGGQEISSADFPGVVAVVSEYWDYATSAWYLRNCTGTVLSSTKVLTASHCVTNLLFGTTEVIAGRTHVSDDTSGYVAQVATTWTHPNYNITTSSTVGLIDDVSILTLRTPLPAAYAPVRLSAQGDQTPYAAGTAATIVGYGVTSAGANDFGVLHKATVPIRSDAECGATWSTRYDPNRMTCAGAPDLGISTCGGDSGGPIMVGGAQVGITDFGGSVCTSTFSVYERLSYYAATIRQDFSRPALVNLDWGSDGHADLFARTPDGYLVQWGGAGFASSVYGGFLNYKVENFAWGGYDKLFRVRNFYGDGRPGIMARDRNGGLFLYKGDGFAFFDGAPVQVGTGWNMYADIMVVTNWNGDGRQNLLGRKANGDLFIYTSDGQGGWLNNGIGIQIGNGWSMFDTVLTPGSWTGDGQQSLIGRTPSGDLYLYNSNGAGGWQNNGVGIRIGTGWNTFSVFMSPGDWNGDNMIDLIGIQPDGLVKLYRTDGHGNWLEVNGTGMPIATGWNQYNAVF